jgi:hypothetical protein
MEMLRLFNDSVATIFLVFVIGAHAMDLPMLFLASNMICDDFKEQVILQRFQKNYFDELPLELHHKIVKNIFDLTLHKDEDCKKHINQEKLEKYVPSMPLFLGTKLAHEFSQFQKICQYKIGFKKFVARQLFVLPCQERDLFMRLGNRSIFQEGDMYADDKKIIVNMPNHIKKGLCLTVNHLHPVLDCIKNVSGLSAFLGSLSFVATLNIPVKSQYYQKVSQYIMIEFFGSLGTLFFCNFLTGPQYGRDGYLKKIKL